MRLTIRAKQIAGVTALVGGVVVALSALYVTRLAQVVLHEGQARGRMLANAILDRAREVAASGSEARAAVVRDDGLRAILRSSLYGENVTDASILDRHGTVIASSDPGLIGRRLPERVDIGALVESSPLAQLRAIYYPRDGQYVEVREPLRLGTEDFGTVRVASSTLLMRDELNKALEPALYTATAALLVSVLVALLLAQVLLRPIHVIRSGLTRLGRGEFGVTLDLPPGDEFGELGSFFNAVSQQLSTDRLLLAGQKANLQSAVEHLEDGVALFNASGQLLFSNPAMREALPPDAVGRPVEQLLQAGHVYRTIVEETLATGRSKGPVEARDDELLMAHAVAGTDGTLIGVLLVSRNVGYLSRMQSTLAYSRKLVALGRLTAGIAHEVKNPLNAMMIHLELLRTKIARAALHPVPAGTPPVVGHGEAEVAPAGLEHIAIIEKEIRRLDEVVQGFLKFTRPEELHLQPVALGTIIEEVVPVVQPEADRSRVRMVIDTPASLPKVNGDAAMLRQALLNLAINACQAMPDGGTLRIACAPAGRHLVEVRVEDTGIGIPPENLGRIFDLYFTTKDHGTGIGLSMVYRIVQMHDGEIEVQSTPGRGTTFRLLLPLVGSHMQDRTSVTRSTVTALLALCLSGSALVCGGCAKARAAELVPDGPPLAVPLPPPRLIAPLEDPAPPPAPVAEAPPPAPARPTPPRTPPRREPEALPAAPAAAAASAPPATTPEPTRDLRPAFDPGAERQVRDRLARAARDLNRVDYRRLSGVGKSQYEQAKRFAEQAEQALKERNYVFANTLADKSATIAAELLR